MNQLRSWIIASLLCATTITALGQSDDGIRKITTAGDSAIFVAPDEAVISFGVTTISKELTDAKAQNEQVANKLTSAVKTLNLEPRYFAMDGMQVNLQYNNYNGGNGNDPIGFNVSRGYKITVKDISKLQQVIDTVLTNGANSFYISMNSSELRKHRDEARTMAVKAAKEKAVALAAALDCKVGSARTITETADTWGSYRGNVKDLALNSFQEMPSVVGADADGTPLGQISITAKVNVTFDLIPGPVNK